MASRNRLSVDGRSYRTLEQFLLVLTAMCILAISVWVLVQSPARGYEEMYDAYPAPFWGLIAVGFAASIVVFVLSAMRNDGYWKLSLAFACGLYLLYNFLPLFRGWTVYGRGDDDVLTHIGLATSILESNAIPDWNIYPGFHVLLAEFNLAGFELETLTILFMAVFTILYLLGIHLFVRELTDDRRAGVIVLAVAIVPLYAKFQHAFLPAILSFMLLPLFLFLVERYRSTGMAAYLGFSLLLAFVLVVSHPVTTAFAVAILGTSIAAQAIHARLSTQPFTGARYLPALGTLLGGGALWYGQFPWMRRNVLVVLGIVEDDGSSVAETYGTSQVEGAQSLQQLVLGFIESYGPIFLVLCLGALAAVIALVRVWRRDASYANVWLPSQYAVSALVTGVGIFTYVVAHHPVRNAKYSIFVATLLAGVLLFWTVRPRLEQRTNTRRVAMVLVVALLLVSVPIAVANTYHAHTHLTHTEKDGTEWVYGNHNPDYQAINHQSSAKMQDYLYGGRHDDPRFDGIGEDSPMPQGLGYESNDSIGETVDGEETYLVTKEFDTESPDAIREFARDPYLVYDEESLQQLGNDPTADHIYENGDFTVWYTRGSEPTNSSE